MRQKIEQGLSQKSLVTMIRGRLSGLTNVRTGENSRYELSDAALSAFAVFFLQNPSFLAQQIDLQNAVAMIRLSQ